MSRQGPGRWTAVVYSSIQHLDVADDLPVELLPGTKPNQLRLLRVEAGPTGAHQGIDVGHRAAL